MTLAIDLRRDGDAAPGSAALDADAILAHDIGAAVKYLLDNGADPDNLFIAGASIGANLALHYAVTDPRIQAVILLSPGEDYRGVRVMPALDDYTQRPLLIMASEGDSYSAATARKMQEAAESQCELRIYPGSAHGTDILNAAGNATGQIFLWLEPIVQR
jgi:acetyl esterase/lipase